MLKILLFQTTPNLFELWSNGIKIAFFPKNYKKLLSGCGFRPKTPIASSGWELCPQIPACDTFELHNFDQFVSQFTLFSFGLSPLPIAKAWLCANTQVMASDLSIYNIFVPQKVSHSKISDDVIACDLWFGLPPIKNSGQTYVGF